MTFRGRTVTQGAFPIGNAFLFPIGNAIPLDDIREFS